MLYIKNIQNNYLLSFYCLIFFASIYPVDWKGELYKRIHENVIPEWMEKQIKSDLLPFVAGIDRSIFVNYNDQYAHISIVNDIIKIEWDNTQTQNENKCKLLLRVLEIIGSVVSIPNVEFLVDLSDNPTRSMQGPIFCFVKNILDDHSILLPDLYNLNFVKIGIDFFGDKIVKRENKKLWESKIKKAFWRGDTVDYNNINQYDVESCYNFSRFMLVKMGTKFLKLIDAKFSTFAYNCTPDFIKKYSNELYLENLVFKQKRFKYKYQISIDGAPSQWTELRTQLFSFSTILKCDHEYIQWYCGGLKPYIHYVPFNADLSDLVEKIQWLIKNDKQAKKIAWNATEFARNNLRYSDMLYYIYLVLREYASLQKFVPSY